jgi:CBS domain-containing protein
VDVASFLGRHAPFDALEPAVLADVASRVQIEHFAPGSTILQESGDPSRFLYVIRKGAVEVLEGGRLVDLLGQGETFGEPSVLSGLAPTATVRAHEDTLCYLIDDATTAAVLGSAAGVRFLARSQHRRVFTSRGAEVVAEREPGALRAVGELVRRPAVTCDAGTTVAEAAEQMTRERVSCLLVPTSQGLGILTDRDLRSRVVASRRDVATPVSEVMSFPASAVPADTPAGEVLLRMLDGGFHHFPVIGSGGDLLGVVTDTDLMDLGRHTPFALKSQIERAPDADAVARAGRELPLVVAALVASSADPVDIGRVVALTIDTLTRRLIDLAIHDLGEPPVPWAWIALGSAARQEQALVTDQDHAIAFDPRGRSEQDLDRYFSALAGSVTVGLGSSGIPPCRGDAMASHPQMRRSLDGWRSAYRAWISEPGSEGSILVSIALDHRRVTGPLDVDPSLDELIRDIPRHPLFVRQLVKRTLDHRPPTGFFGDLVVQAKGDHAGRLDIKHGGITIVANLARAVALAHGLTPTSTLARLRAAEAAGSIDAETRAGLEEAFRFLWRARLEHETRRLDEGRPPDDFLDPAELGTVARQGLKEAFRVIARAQRTAAAELGASVR